MFYKIFTFILKPLFYQWFEVVRISTVYSKFQRKEVIFRPYSSTSANSCEKHCSEDTLGPWDLCIRYVGSMRTLPENVFDPLNLWVHIIFEDMDSWDICLRICWVCEIFVWGYVRSIRSLLEDMLVHEICEDMLVHLWFTAKNVSKHGPILV